MGVVYKAFDEQLQRNVALKVLPPAIFSDVSARARLLREARSAAALNHPDICTVHEVGEAGGQTFIAMELVEGETLAARLSSGPLEITDVRRFGLQLADALAHAHERGIVHRDLKASNIIITREGRLKILDFGLAKQLDPEGLEGVTKSENTLTVPGAIVGTLAYMAPEELRGQPGDAQSDIWALGVVLFEMTTGSLPFRGHTSFEVCSAILNQPPAVLPAGVPVNLRAVIERCLEKEPKHRYQGAREARAVLETGQTGAGSGWSIWRYTLVRNRWRTLAALGVMLLTILVGLNASRMRAWLTGDAVQPKFDSLAVLPFENLSGDPDQDYLAEGMHEALITELAQIKGLRRVIARSSVMRYQRTQEPLPHIARELGVDALMTGSVLRSGNRVRITAHLIKAANEEQLWSDSYEREMRDVLSLQNEIVAAITRKTKLQLTPQEHARLTTARQVNPEAYEAYLRGMFHYNKFTPDGFEKGRAYLQQAIEKDPADPLPYAGLALGYSLVGHEQAPETFPLAKAAALKALELDDTLPQAHEALAKIKLYGDWDWAGALENFQHALETSPNLAQAHAHYSWYLQLAGTMDQAIEEMKRAQELDPLTPLWSAWLGWQYWEAGRYDEALDAARISLELDPNFPVGLYILGAAYAEKGMYAEAIDAHQRAGVASPAWRWPLGRTYVLAGREDEARKIAAELEKEHTGFNPWGLAEIYAALGEKDSAFRWLEVCFQTRAGYMPWVWIEVPFRSLHDDRRFEDLLRRINLPSSRH